MDQLVAEDKRARVDSSLRLVTPALAPGFGFARLDARLSFENAEKE
jgi:hypothetical protein